MAVRRGGESEDSEGENQELAQIDRERRRNCGLTPLATSQQHNQGALSPARLRRLRVLLDPALDRHSSEEELERIIREDRKWAEHSNSVSSDEEVKDLCAPPRRAGAPPASPRPPSPRALQRLPSPQPAAPAPGPAQTAAPQPLRAAGHALPPAPTRVRQRAVQAEPGPGEDA
ncbi:hypothetical protein SKAU_G00303080, partial [Synaphobranchus kaupii]